MAQKELTRADVIRQLWRIACSRPSAAVALAYQEKPSREAIQRLDLGAVSEFRRNSAGSVEIKFVDRVKALQVLYELLGGGMDTDGTDAFFRALEEAGVEEAWQA